MGFVRCIWESVFYTVATGLLLVVMALAYLLLLPVVLYAYWDISRQIHGRL